MPSSLPMAPAAAPVTRRRGLRAALALPLAAVLSLPLITAAMTPPAPTHPAAGALLRAAREGDLPAVKQALAAGAPLESRDADGRTLLLLATHGHHLPVVCWLIGRGADVNAQDRQRDSAFLLAGPRGYTEIVRAALRAGARLVITNRYGGTALIPACERGHVETVRVLLATDIDVDHVNHLGWTALLEAVILGSGGGAHQAIVSLLLARGAQVNLADLEGVTPLQHAERQGQRAVAALLRAAGGR